jgi:hypothetical protein
VKNGRKDNIKHTLIDMREKLSNLFKGVIGAGYVPVQPLLVKADQLRENYREIFFKINTTYFLVQKIQLMRCHALLQAAPAGAR